MDIILGLVIIDLVLIVLYSTLSFFSEKLKIKKELILPLIHIIEIVTAGLVGYIAGKGGI
ncbi:hypothetical protein KY332_01475 [Candidatus Woesearchaeota archaeon]|nr:hypothetical protein [Candidatus Woesearchaeota archaeon]